MKTNGIVSDDHHGGRSLHSTVTAVTLTHDAVLDNIYNDKN